MAFLEKIPSWLRWILFLPLALIAFFLATVIISSGQPEEGLFGQIFVWALAGGLAAFVFVWVGAKVAPRAQFQISINLAVFYGLYCFGVLAGRYEDPEGLSWTQVIVNLGAGLI